MRDLPVVADATVAFAHGATSDSALGPSRIEILQVLHPGVAERGATALLLFHANRLCRVRPRSVAGLVCGWGTSLVLVSTMARGAGALERAFDDDAYTVRSLGSVRVSDVRHAHRLTGGSPRLVVGSLAFDLATRATPEQRWDPTLLGRAVEGCLWPISEEHLRRFGGRCPGRVAGDPLACAVATGVRAAELRPDAPVPTIAELEALYRLDEPTGRD